MHRMAPYIRLHMDAAAAATQGVAGYGRGNPGSHLQVVLAPPASSTASASAAELSLLMYTKNEIPF